MPRNWCRRCAETAALALAAPTLLGAAAPTVHTVTMERLSYAPATVTAKPGDAVMWVNADAFRHTATAEAPAFDVDLEPGAKGSVKLTKAGTVNYRCRFHPGMKGHIKVAP